jgi:hypothetical protein
VYPLLGSGETDAISIIYIVRLRQEAQPDEIHSVSTGLHLCWERMLAIPTFVSGEIE